MIDDIKDPAVRMKVELRTLRREITDDVHQHQRPSASSAMLDMTLGLLSKGTTQLSTTESAHGAKNGSSGRRGSTDGSVRSGKSPKKAKRTGAQQASIKRLQHVERKFGRMDEHFAVLESNRCWNKVSVQK